MVARTKAVAPEVEVSKARIEPQERLCLRALQAFRAGTTTPQETIEGIEISKSPSNSVTLQETEKTF